MYLQHGNLQASLRDVSLARFGIRLGLRRSFGVQPDARGGPPKISSQTVFEQCLSNQKSDDRRHEPRATSSPKSAPQRPIRKPSRDELNSVSEIGQWTVRGAIDVNPICQTVKSVLSSATPVAVYSQSSSAVVHSKTTNCQGSSSAGVHSKTTNCQGSSSAEVHSKTTNCQCSSSAGRHSKTTSCQGSVSCSAW